MKTDRMAERVYAASGWKSPAGGVEGRLVNEVGGVKWRCIHRHRLDTAAVRCADRRRRQWIRAGLAPR